MRRSNDEALKNEYPAIEKETSSGSSGSIHRRKAKFSYSGSSRRDGRLKVASFNIERATKILCQELNTGKGYTGFFYLDAKTISTEICSYDKSFYLVPEKPIFLRTENNQIVSLHSNISTFPGAHSRTIDPEMVTYKQHIISNTALIGRDRWEETDKLKRG